MLSKMILAGAVAVTLSSGLAYAADHDDHHHLNRVHDEGLWDRQHKGACQLPVRANICKEYRFDNYGGPGNY